MNPLLDGGQARIEAFVGLLVAAPFALNEPRNDREERSRDPRENRGRVDVDLDGFGEGHDGTTGRTTYVSAGSGSVVDPIPFVDFCVEK